MADLSKIGCDALRFYHSGASSSGAAQSDQSLCLGGYISSNEVTFYDISVSSPITNVSILYASFALPEGSTVKLVCDATDTIHLEVNGQSGEDITLADGNTVHVHCNNLGKPEWFVRVSRSGSMATGTATLTLSTKLNNVLSMQDISSAQASSGLSKYRMVFLKNVSADTVGNVRVFLSKQGTKRVSATTQLGASGSGTITIASGTFNDWPSAGWCRVENSAGALKELVYYTSRTSTALTVPSAGRGLLGTSATAGSSTDFVIPIPGIRIGLDDDGVDLSSHLFPTVAGETTAPTTVSAYWASGTDEDEDLEHALYVLSIPSGSVIPIWIHKQYPAGSIASTLVYTGLQVTFDGTAL